MSGLLTADRSRCCLSLLPPKPRRRMADGAAAHSVTDGLQSLGEQKGNRSMQETNHGGEGGRQSRSRKLPADVEVGLLPDPLLPPPDPFLPTAAADPGSEAASANEIYRRSALAKTPRLGRMTPEQERMMVESLPTVRYLARRIHERLPQHVDMEDLVSAGVVGLIDAFQKFDPEKKVQFRSYAQFRIRGSILDSLRTLDWSPRELRRKGRAVEAAIRTLMALYGRAPLETEVAAQMELPLGEYQQLLGELKGLEIGTLNAERSEDSGEEELAYIPNKAEDDPLFRFLRGELQEKLTGAIDRLPERERLVMTLYYYEEMTMKEIGLTLGVVESRVSQIHASAVLHLRVTLVALRPAHATSRRRGERRRKP
jgi:RNA polymerase sigma factor for flagellar operon FliA